MAAYALRAPCPGEGPPYSSLLKLWMTESGTFTLTMTINVSWRTNT